MIADLPAYSEYAPGFPWTGDLPSHWDRKRGKALFEKMARPVRPDDETVTCFRDGVVTLRKNRRLRGFTESLKEIGYQGVRKGDLVIHAMDAFAGAAGVSDSDGKSTPVYSVCRPRTNANSAYYGYLVRQMARSQWILALAKGIRERSTDFRFEAFGGQYLPVPPPQEQSAIVRFLAEADRRINRLIRNKRRLIELLNEQKQAIITQAVTRGLDPSVPMKASGVEWLGDVPEHWTATSLGRVTSAFKTGPFGSILHQSDYVSGGIPLVNPTHLRGGRIQPDPECSVDADTARRLRDYSLGLHDVVFSRRGELGRCALVRSHDGPMLCGTGSIRAQIQYDGLDPEYLIAALQVSWVGSFLSLYSVGATMESLNTGILKRLPLLIPPLSEQTELLKYIDGHTVTIRNGIERAGTEIEHIREYRTRLIADVVTGKLDVRVAAADLPDPADTEPEPADALDDDADLDAAEEELEEEVAS